MSEEDAFLDGIAADRADRTRLLVFADWLADRSDPREEFVRLHAKLLDMDGTEPEFEELETRWNRCGWEAAAALVGSRIRASWPIAGWMPFAQACTVSEAELCLRSNATRFIAPEHEYEVERGYDTLLLYHEPVRASLSVMEFLSETVLTNLREDEWFSCEGPSSTRSQAIRSRVAPSGGIGASVLLICPIRRRFRRSRQITSSTARSTSVAGGVIGL